MQLLATPRSEDWGDLDEWLADATLMIPDEPGGQAHLQEEAEETQERLRRGHERWTKYDAGELAERTIRPEDGR